MSYLNGALGLWSMVAAHSSKHPHKKVEHLPLNRFLHNLTSHEDIWNRTMFAKNLVLINALICPCPNPQPNAKTRQKNSLLNTRKNKAPNSEEAKNITSVKLLTKLNVFLENKKLALNSNTELTQTDWNFLSLLTHTEITKMMFLHERKTKTPKMLGTLPGR